MKQVFRDRKGTIKVEDIPSPHLLSGRVLVKTYYSLISSGTEVRSLQDSQQSGTILKTALNKRHAVKKFISDSVHIDPAFAYRSLKHKAGALAPLGYSCAGVVIDKDPAITEFSKGDLVVCGGYEYAHHADVVSVPKNLVSKIPSGVDIREAVFAPVAGIALHAVRRSQVSLGESVLVVGLGLIGQMVVQLLTLQGCRVVGVDPSREKTQLAARYGAAGVHTGKDHYSKHVLAFNNSQPFDAAILCTKITEPHYLDEVVDSVRNKGRIVAVGDLSVPYPFSKLVRKEIDVLVSRSHGPGRFDSSYEEKGLTYPVEYVRWTSDRNIQHILQLLREKKISFLQLISKEYPVDQAQQAYTFLMQKKDAVGILLSYSKHPDEKTSYTLSTRTKPDGKIGVAVAGMGLHAKTVLLPEILKQPDFSLESVMSSDGLRGKEAAEIFHSRSYTTSFDDTLKDPAVDLVFISTRNKQHAAMAVQAAQAKKNIYLEKPMALTEEECQHITHAVKRNRVFFTLGLSRRFSPLIQRAKHNINPEKPTTIHYHFLDEIKPEKQWVDEEGGRIIYMFCHIIDVAAYLLDAEPVTVYATHSRTSSSHHEDHVTATVTFDNGSTLIIFYHLVPPHGQKYETIEIHNGETLLTIKNFKEFTLASPTEHDHVILDHADKGHTNQLHQLADALRGKEASFVTLKDAVRATVFPFRVLESLRKGQPVSLHLKT